MKVNLEGAIDQLVKAQEILAQAVDDLIEAKSDLVKVQAEIDTAEEEEEAKVRRKEDEEGRRTEEEEEGKRRREEEEARMFLVMHSLSGALRYLAPVPALESGEVTEEEEEARLDLSSLCTGCRGCLDQVAPLPGEQRRRSFGGEEEPSLITGRRRSGAGRQVVSPGRSRHRSDTLQGGEAARGAVRVRLGLTRNTSAGQFQTEGAKQLIPPSPSLPRTLSESVLRIRQRRSFWEKFVQ